MFNYSEANLDSLNNDLDSTIEECKKLVKNIKSSTNINLSDFDELESTVYDVSGRVAFLGNVHPEEKIRDFGKGSPMIPMSYDEVADKFLGCCEFAKWPSKKSKALIELVRNLEKVKDISKLSKLLSK